MRASGQLTSAQRESLDLRQELQNLRSLGEENSLLALVASKTNAAVGILTVEGVIEWANDAFTHLTGYQHAEIAGQHFLSLFGKDHNNFIFSLAIELIKHIALNLAFKYGQRRVRQFSPLELLAVDVEPAIFNLDRIPGKGYDSFDIVLSAAIRVRKHYYVPSFRIRAVVDHLVCQ